jgi:hypothetical protein
MSESERHDNSRDDDDGIHPYPGQDRPAGPDAEQMTGTGEDTPTALPSEMEGHQE